MKLLKRCSRRSQSSIADSKSRQSRSLDHSNREAPLKGPPVAFEAQYRTSCHRALLGGTRRENLLLMEVSPAAVRSATFQSEIPTLHLCASWLDNGIGHLLMCTSSSQAACYRTSPSPWHKGSKIEPDWCYRLCETGSSIRVASVWTLDRHTVSTGSLFVMRHERLTLVERLVTLHAPQDGENISFRHFVLDRR
jgi:hypothetical protein